MNQEIQTLYAELLALEKETYGNSKIFERLKVMWDTVKKMEEEIPFVSRLQPIKHKKHQSQKSIALKIMVARKNHKRNKPIYPGHDTECPACNPQSILTWEQYRGKCMKYMAAYAHNKYVQGLQEQNLPYRSSLENRNDNIPNSRLE